MNRRVKLLTTTLALALATLLAGGGTPQGNPVQAAPPKAAAAPHVFVVQIRHPIWRVIPAPNRPAATVLQANLLRQGWKAQVKTDRLGRVYVRAKMPRWRTRTVVANRAQANVMANILRIQQFEARVV